MSPVVALYVPGNRPDRFDNAVASGADVVILDLEDAVPSADKAAARAAVVDWLGRTPGVAVQVRVNAPGSVERSDDLARLPSDVDVRSPKVNGPGDLDDLGSRRVHPILESAVGIERAYDIAQHPAVASLSLGEADLAADLGIEGDDALAWVRQRVVVAAIAAGLPAPMMSVFRAIPDLAGLAASCAAGRRLGMRGRAAIHPSQIPVIRSVFEPSAKELRWAAEVLAVVEDSGVGTLADGSMVDEAMARRARAILARPG